MRRVHHDRVSGLRHLRQAAHVGDQRVVPKRGAAFCEQDALVAGGFNLGDDIGHVPRGQKLAFLHIDDLARIACGQQHIGLAAQEGGDLQDVHCFGGDGTLGFGVNIRQNRHADGLAHRLQHGQTFVDAKPAFAAKRGAVGLVIAGLEHELRADGVAGLFHLAGNHLGVGFAFQLARACDHRQRAIIPDNDISNGDLGHFVTCSFRIEEVSDSMR